MSRKRKRPVPRGHLNEVLRDESRERDILHSEIYKDPKIQNILTRMSTATELEALDLALQLQKIARGKASLLENPELSDVVSSMRANADARDKAQKAWDTDAAAFLEDAWNRAEKKKLTGSKAEEARKNYLKAKGLATAGAKMSRALRRKQLEEQLRSEPTETINVVGTPSLLRKGQSLQMVIEPVRISIGHLAWILPTGTHTVPASVAARHRDMTSGLEERQKRSDLLDATSIKDENKIHSEWQSITDSSGTHADPFPVSGGY